jgi:hypothetical protein
VLVASTQHWAQKLVQGPGNPRQKRQLDFVTSFPLQA